MATTAVHTCPRCGLRFATTAEMDDHLVTDHHVVLRRMAYPERMRAQPAGLAPPVCGVLAVPVDASREPSCGVGIAAALARQAALGLDFVAVRPPWLSRAATEAHLAARAGEASAAGAPSTSWRDLGEGDPAEQILEHVEATKPALLCMATRSRGPLGGAVLGSVCEAVLRRAPVPVVLVGPRARPPAAPYRRLIVGIDGSTLAAHAATVAMELGGLLSAEVFLVEVREPGCLPDDVSEMADLSRLAAALGQSPVGYDILHGRHAAGAILDHGRHREDSLFVLGTHGRSHLRRLTMGSVALDVVRGADCPVIVVPDAARMVHAPATRVAGKA